MRKQGFQNLFDTMELRDSWKSLCTCARVEDVVWGRACIAMAHGGSDEKLWSVDEHKQSHTPMEDPDLAQDDNRDSMAKDEKDNFDHGKTKRHCC
jgi:hypothetical protein